MSERKIAEVFPPGEFIKDALEAKGWTQEDLAAITGRNEKSISQIMTGKSNITPETAQLLGEAFGTSAQYWMNLDAAYRLHNTDIRNSGVTQRAKLYSKAPIKEMIKRNWIEPSDNITVLEQRVLDFFEIKDLDEEPKVFAHQPRKSTPYDLTTMNQIAWLYRARYLSQAVHAGEFAGHKFDALLERLNLLLENPMEVRHVPKLLADAGIKFLLIRNLPNTKIDGASFWIQERSPVIALSMRYDRIDWFWYTLMHELGHIYHRDGALDVEIYSDNSGAENDKPASEKVADEFASNSLVPPGQLESFISRVGPFYSKRRIEGFAKRLRVHPGIVVGQLHYKGEIDYSNNRNLLARVRDVIMPSSLSDGWDNPLPASLARGGGNA